MTVSTGISGMTASKSVASRTTFAGVPREGEQERAMAVAAVDRTLPYGRWRWSATGQSVSRWCSSGFGSILAGLDRYYAPLDRISITLALYRAFRL